VDNVAIPAKRIAYLDVAKGIGILLVVLGHKYIKGSLPGLGKFIFSFHLPFFFLLSGMFFKPDYPLWVLFKSRFAMLIRPFLAGMLWAGIVFLPVYYMKEVTVAGQTILLDGLPASMDLLLITGTYFLIGYELRKLAPERFFTSTWTLLLSGLVLVALNILYPYQIDFFFRTYDSFFVNTLEALSGSVFVIALSARISLRQNWLFATLKYLGEITIILLIFHQPAQTLTFGQVMRWVDNPFIAGPVSFIAAVGVSVLVHQLILKDNPRLASWFGMRQPAPAPVETNV